MAAAALPAAPARYRVSAVITSDAATMPGVATTTRPVSPRAGLWRPGGHLFRRKSNLFARNRGGVGGAVGCVDADVTCGDREARGVGRDRLCLGDNATRDGRDSGCFADGQE